MTEYKFDNEYDVILFTLFIILDQLERKDQIFAAQCIWWLASIIQYTEILLFYRQYKIFPSYYVKNCIVTRLPEVNQSVQPEREIPKLELAEAITEDSEHPTLQRNLATIRTTIRSTRSGRVFKPQYIMQRTIAKRSPGKSHKQLQEMRN